MVGKSLTSSLQALKCSWNSFWAAERKQQKVCEWPSMLVFPITNLVASIHCCIRFAQTVNLPRNMIFVVNWVEENEKPGSTGWKTKNLGGTMEGSREKLLLALQVRLDKCYPVQWSKIATCHGHWTTFMLICMSENFIWVAPKLSFFNICLL